MPDQVAYERDVSSDSTELWRVETELATAFGPLFKVWYTPKLADAIAIRAYAEQQSGATVVITHYVRDGKATIRPLASDSYRACIEERQA